MADFTALKTAIQTYIKQNGNEEITGEKLQEILLSMVTTLGDSAINDLITALNDEVAARQNADGTLQQNITNEATARGNGDTALSDRLGSSITAENTAADQIGAEAEARAAADTALQDLIDGITENIENGYVYAGIATPSSTPATGKVFYLALTAGTYTNFGSTVVSQGINILKYNGSAWSLDAFIGIDDELTPSSNKLPKSGNVLENIIKNGSAFDLSAYNAVDGVLATYADLSAALTALNGLPAVYKQGGMSFRFVCTSDNKYVRYNYMGISTAVADFTSIANWQRSDEDIEYNDTVTVSNPTLSLQTQLVQGLAIKAGVTLRIKATTQQSWNRLLLGFNGVNANRIKDNIVNGEDIYFVTPEPITSFWYYVTSSASNFAFSVDFETFSYMELLEEINSFKDNQNTNNAANSLYNIKKRVSGISITTEDSGKFLLPDGTKWPNQSWAIKRLTTSVSETVAIFENVGVPAMGNLVCSFYNSSNVKIGDFVFYPTTSSLTVNCKVYIPATCAYILVNVITHQNFKCYTTSIHSDKYPFDTFPWYLFDKSRIQTTNLLSRYNIVENFVIDILSDHLSFSVNNLYYTAIVLLKPNTQYIANFKIRAIVYFDAYDAYLDKVTTEVAANTVFTTPANTAKMYMLIRKEYLADDAMLVEGSSVPEYCEPDIIPAAYTDVLAHKKWVAAGDSFTHGDFNGLSSGYTFTSGLYTGENKVYPFYIGRRNPTMMVINTGVNGLTLQTYVSDEMYLDIPADTDIYTIKIGINDSHQNIPIGTLSDSTTDTFCGCWNILLEWLTANRPNMKIGLIASNGCDTVEYSYATANIAKKYGILCLNEEKGDDVPFFYRQTWKNTTQSRRTALTNLYRVTSTNGHPNAKCHEFESTLIENFLRRL